MQLCIDVLKKILPLFQNNEIMIISVMNLKGGVGKTTVSTNLATCFAHDGFKVCIGDLDNSQFSSKKWNTQRGGVKPEIPVFGASGYKSQSGFSSDEGKEMAQTVKSLSKDYEVVILDGAPVFEELATWMILVSDLVVCPIQTSALDVWTMKNIKQKIDQLSAMGQEKEVRLLLNFYNAQRRLDKDIEQALVDIGMNVFKSRISNRVAYKEAIIDGLGVIETGDKKAAAEMETVFEEIKSTVLVNQKS
jgi:chromosome partitioning protein